MDLQQRWLRLNVLLLLVLLESYGGPAFAQSIPPDEIPFNEAIYKASHNSYARSESLADQVSAYNVWQIELDVYDYEGDLKVNHLCDPGSIASSSSLAALLTSLSSQLRQQALRHFTVIYVDMKGNGGEGCAYGWGGTLTGRLRQTFIASLGADTMYPSQEFVDKDAMAWPSYQELERRGYRWAVVIDWHGSEPELAKDDPLLFGTTSEKLPDAQKLPPKTVLLNVSGGCDASPVGEDAHQRGTRFLARLWPDSCAPACAEMDDGYWTAGIAHNYNFIATNCVNRGHTFDARVHAPDPLFVDGQVKNSCPDGQDPCQWGTARFPFQDFGAALRRISPGSEMRIVSGTYLIAPDVRIDRPIAVRATSEGSVIIR